MKICRFVDIEGEGRGGAAGGGGGPGGRGVRVGYLDGDVVVPVADGEGRAGMEAVLEFNTREALNKSGVCDGSISVTLDLIAP